LVLAYLVLHSFTGNSIRQFSFLGNAISSVVGAPHWGNLAAGKEQFRWFSGLVDTELSVGSYHDNYSSRAHDEFNKDLSRKFRTEAQARVAYPANDGGIVDEHPCVPSPTNPYFPFR
jgi:hypothetical protein